MGDNLVLLAYRASSNKFGDKNRKARPPKVPLDYGLGTEVTKVARKGGVMDRMQQGRARHRWDIHSTTEIQVAVVKGPILEGGVREQGRSICEVGNGTENQGVRGGGGFDMASKSEVECLDDYWVRDDRGIDIIRGSVNGVSMGEGIGGGHLGTRENLPDNIKVLEKEGPAGLSSRQFAGVFDIGEIFVVSDDGDRMRSSLDILLPFFQCKDHRKEFAIIDVIVLFGKNERLGEIGARVGITIEIILEENSSSSEEGSIGHDGKGARNVRDAKDRSGGKGGAEGVESPLLK